MLRVHFCDYCDAYLVAEGTVTVTDPNDVNNNKKLAFKNNAWFFTCVSKTNNALIDNAEDLDIVMPINNLIEYSKNYSKTSESLWKYYRDEPNSGVGGANNNVNYSIKDSKSFEYKTSIAEKLEGINTKKEKVKIIAPLKHLSNFWKTWY